MVVHVMVLEIIIFFESGLKRWTILYLHMHVSINTIKAHCSIFLEQTFG